MRRLKTHVAKLNATELERINGVKQRFTAIQTELQAMEVSRAAAVQWKAGIAGRDRIEAEVMKLTAAVECYKLGKELVTKLREEAVEKTFGSVLTVAGTSRTVC